MFILNNGPSSNKTRKSINNIFTNNNNCHHSYDKSCIDRQIIDNTENNLGSSQENISHHHSKQNTLYSTPILLVDDEEELLFTFSMLLKQEGYTNVKAFSNSENMLKYPIINEKWSKQNQLLLINIVY